MLTMIFAPGSPSLPTFKHVSFYSRTPAKEIPCLLWKQNIHEVYLRLSR